MYDECKKSNDIIVCHKLWSISWSIVQVYSLTIEYQVFQYVPSLSISEQFKSILLTILPRISILLLWNDGHKCMELILCTVVESSCLPTHNIIPHISWHDLPYHKTMRKYTDFPNMVIFLLLLRKFRIQTFFCNCQQYLCLFHMVFEYILGVHVQGKMLILPNQLLYWILSTSDQSFVSFQPILYHPHTQIKIFLFHGVRISIHNWKLSPTRTSIGFFSNCSSHICPAKGWPYRFRARGTTGSSILDHDFGHLCRGRRTQKSGHSDLGIFNNFGASSILTWVQADTASAACRQSGCDIHDFCCRHLWCWWSQQKIQNHLSQYRLGVQLDLCIFGALPPIRHSSNDRCPSVRQNELFLRPCFIDHLWFTSDFCQVPNRNLFKFLLFFIHCCFCCGYLHCLRHRTKFVNQIIMLQWIVSISCNMVLMMIR